VIIFYIKTKSNIMLTELLIFVDTTRDITI